MTAIRAAIIGTGEKKPRPDLNGFFMAYQHGPAYRAIPGCSLVACADLVPVRAEAFAKEMEIPSVYTDYREMLAAEKPDIVSICTWPDSHAAIVLDCIEAGVPAIHCEKPMALLFGDCFRMLEAAEAKGTKLTFNHQRRFGKPFRETRRLVAEGVIGELQRMESACGELYDGGCHWVDLLNYFNGETEAEWVIGQVDFRRVRYAFGAPSEFQGIYHVKYANGVTAAIATGPEVNTFGPAFRLVGTGGIIEIGWSTRPGPMLRYLQFERAGWTVVDTGGEDLHGPGYIPRAIADVVDCLATGRTSELCMENQMKSMQIVFGGYESSRRRARVDLPFSVPDNPIVTMLAEGRLKPDA